MKEELTIHQQEVHDAIINDIMENLTSPIRSNAEINMLSLSGAAGTGKSYLTAKMTKTLTMKLSNYPNDGICITAPTHKAVKVINDLLKFHHIKADCRTIHSFLNLKPKIDYTTGEEKFTVIRTKQAPPRASLLIVDESSMVSSELFDFILEAVNRGRVNTVLFIGDPYQLLPVNNNENKVNSLKRQYSLNEVVRQAKGSGIIALATKIRHRIASQEFIGLRELLKDCESDVIEIFDDKNEFIQDFCKNEDWFQEDKILASYTNSSVDAFNKQIRDLYWSERNINNPPQFMSNDTIRFKVPFDNGANFDINKVILYQNGEEVKIAKAELMHHEATGINFWKCTVDGRNEKDFFRVIDTDSIVAFNAILEQYIRMAKTIGYPHNKEFWRLYYKHKNSFADVQYAFSSTIHKLQGSTYDSTYIDISNLVNNQQISNDAKYRLLYVAITRSRKNVKIFY